MALNNAYEAEKVRYVRKPAPSQAEGKIITLGNLKGGTGKSTLAVNLAASFLEMNKRVCIVDSDPQLTSVAWIKNSDMPIHTVAISAQSIGKVENWLRQARRLVRYYDRVLIDLPAVLTPCLASAFLLSHMILVPVVPTALDVHGTKRVMRYIRMVREERIGAMPQVMLVPTRVPRAFDSLAHLKRSLGELRESVAPSIREKRLYSKAFEQGDWVGGLEYNSPAHRDILALRELVEARLVLAEEPPLLSSPLPDLGRNGQKRSIAWTTMPAARPAPQESNGIFGKWISQFFLSKSEKNKNQLS